MNNNLNHALNIILNSDFKIIDHDKNTKFIFISSKDNYIYFNYGKLEININNVMQEFLIKYQDLINLLNNNNNFRFKLSFFIGRKQKSIHDKIKYYINDLSYEYINYGIRRQYYINYLDDEMAINKDINVIQFKNKVIFLLKFKDNTILYECFIYENNYLAIIDKININNHSYIKAIQYLIDLDCINIL